MITYYEWYKVVRHNIETTQYNYNKKENVIKQIRKVNILGRE